MIKKSALLFGSLFCLSFLLHSLLVSPFYVATTIIYPSSTHYAEHLLDVGIRFGDEKESGEYIELLKSNKVLAMVCDELVLVSHYSLAEGTPISEASNILRDRIDIARSPNRSLHISVKDYDSEMAAKIANSLVRAADNHLSELIKHSIGNDLDVLQEIIRKKEKEVKQLQDSVADLEKSGDYVRNGEKTPVLRAAESAFSAENNLLIEFRQSEERILNTLKKTVPPAYVISEAVPPSSSNLSPRILFSFLIAFCVVGFRIVWQNRGTWLK